MNETTPWPGSSTGITLASISAKPASASSRRSAASSNEAKNIGAPSQFVVDLVVRIGRAHRREQVAALAEPRRDRAEERRLFRARHVAEHEEADHGVEAPGLERELGCVGALERRMWNALPRPLDLPRRDVDPEQPVALREALRGRASAPAAQLEQIRAVLDQVEQLLDPAHRRRLEARGPGGVALRDGVVAVRDDAFRVVRDRATPPQTRSMTDAIAWPKPMHIVATP